MSYLAPLPICVLAGVLGALGTWVCRRVAVRLGMVCNPNPLIPQHTRPVACCGGAAIAVTLALIGLLIGLPPTTIKAGIRSGPEPLGALIVGSAFFVVLGLIDDLRPFRPAGKFAWQAVGATTAAFLGLCYPFTGWPTLDAGCSIFWMLVVVNAVNVTDVCDGLAGGLAAVALLFFAFVHPSWSILAWAVIGATGGFLLFNWPPASIFLGDAGSHLLGFLVAGMGLSCGQGDERWLEIPTMLFTASVFLFELVFISVVRMRKGLPWWRGSRDHFSLRLQAAGLSKTQTIALAWAVGGTMIGLLVVFRAAGSIGQAGVLGAAGLFFVVSGRILLKHEVPP